MPKKLQLHDYEPVRAAPNRQLRPALEDSWQHSRSMPSADPSVRLQVVSSASSADKLTQPESTVRTLKTEKVYATSGHKLSFAGLFLFTFLVYFRPYELFPSLSWMSKSALVAALVTLAVFVPTQLALENRLTAKPREVKLAFLLLLTGILSVPLALEPARALQSFIEFCKVILMFIVMVNVLRTEKRLRALILLVLFLY